MKGLNSSEGKGRRLKEKPKKKKMAGLRVIGRDRVISTLKEEIR